MYQIEQEREREMKETWERIKEKIGIKDAKIRCNKYIYKQERKTESKNTSEKKGQL